MRTIAIQAGGRSRRMGRDKGLVLLGGRPMIQWVVDRVHGLAEDVLITTNHPNDYAFLGLRMVSDSEPGAGALSGLRTALAAARGEAVLVLACDLPFLARPLAEHLLARASEADVVIPRRSGEFEPLLAVYARGVLPSVEAALAAGRSRMISFFAEVRVLPVEQAELDRYDPAGESFVNVNTPQELAEAEARLAGLSPGQPADTSGQSGIPASTGLADTPAQQADTPGQSGIPASTGLADTPGQQADTPGQLADTSGQSGIPASTGLADASGVSR